MSYIGYEQIICKAGHYSTCDCYEGVDFEEWRCKCGEPMAWWNGVDETNGSYCYNRDEWGDCSADCECCHGTGRIDNYVELEIEKEAEYKECPTCKHMELIKERTYKIPKDKGHLIG